MYPDIEANYATLVRVLLLLDGGLVVIGVVIYKILQAKDKVEEVKVSRSHRRLIPTPGSLGSW